MNSGVNAEGAEKWVKDGREWRIGTEEQVGWIRQDPAPVGDAIPAVFDAYATIELPATGHHEPTDLQAQHADHDRAVVEILNEGSAGQPWWLGFLETGASDVVFPSAPRTMLYASWGYVLVEAGPEEAATWRQDIWGKSLPDLMFPSDRTWLFSTLWDDDWSCVGGSRSLIDAFLSRPELKGRVREIDPSMSMDEVCPPGHKWF
jgi:hypothetical protein